MWLRFAARGSPFRRGQGAQVSQLGEISAARLRLRSRSLERADEGLTLVQNAAPPADVFARVSIHEL
eukprot:6202647-Pleurochrysis_carterae.AAC.1